MNNSKTWLDAPNWTARVGLALTVLFVVLAISTMYLGGSKWIAFALLFCSAPPLTLLGVPAIWAAVKNRKQN